VFQPCHLTDHGWQDCEIVVIQIESLDEEVIVEEDGRERM
jgi:hypothetical protein